MQADLEWTEGVAFGPNGHLAFAGHTTSTALPVTAGAYESVANPAIPNFNGQITAGNDAGFVGWLTLP